MKKALLLLLLLAGCAHKKPVLKHPPGERCAIENGRFVCWVESDDEPDRNASR